MKGPILYLVAISAAEVLVSVANPIIGILLHAVVLIALLVHASLVGDSPVHKLYSGLSLAPMIRILSLSMPLTNIPIMYWYAIIGAPLILATIVSIRVLGYTRKDMGLTTRRLPIQLLIALIGFPLGVLEWLVIRPNGLVTTPTLEAIWLPALILLVGTGFSEELIFRGVLQKAALEWMPLGGLLYVSVLFAVLHLGYFSVLELFFVGTVGLILAWIVVRTGSLVGAVFAHGFLNITLFILVPLWGASVWHLVVPGNPSFASQLPVEAEATPSESEAEIKPLPEAAAEELPAATATSEPSPSASVAERFATATATATPTVSLSATPAGTGSPYGTTTAGSLWPSTASPSAMTTATPGRSVTPAPLSPSATPSATAQRSATPTPTIPSFATATATPTIRTVVVADTLARGLHIRSTASLTTSPVSAQPDGTLLQWLGNEVKADGFTWWNVRDAQNRVGWAIVDNLRLVATPTPASGTIALPASSPTARTSTPTVTPTATLTASTDVSSTAWVMSYDVVPGDSLSGIAQRFGIGVEVLMALNGLSSQNQVVNNQRLRVPAQPVIVYIVQRGDTLGSIATANGANPIRLAQMNNITNINSIQAGQRLLVPLTR